MFHIIDVHPFLTVFDDVTTEPVLGVRYPYFAREPLRFEEHGSYADRDADFVADSYAWQHTFSDILGSLVKHGLVSSSCQEYPVVAWKALEFMEQGEDGLWRMPVGAGDIPLMFRSPPRGGRREMGAIMLLLDDTEALERRLSQLVAKYDSRRDTCSVRFALASPSRDWCWEWSSPGSGPQYFIASTTKLYVTALIMQLRSEGRLDLDAAATDYVGPSVMSGIHVLRGIDCSERITVSELLSHTSGIADYFEQRRRDGSTQLVRPCARTSAGRSTTCFASPRNNCRPSSRRRLPARRSTRTRTSSCLVP